MRTSLRPVICVIFLIASVCLHSAAQAAPTKRVSGESIQKPPSPAPTDESLADETLDLSKFYLKVRLDPAVRPSKLKPGDTVVGSLREDTYLGDHQLYPAGSAVHLTVSGLERERRKPNDYWPWVVKVFTPRHQNRPVFQNATVALGDKQEVPLQVRMISLGNEKEVRAKSKKSGSASADAKAVSIQQEQAPKSKAGPVMVLEGVAPEQPVMDFRRSVPETIAAGTPAKIILLEDVSASKSRAGDSVVARLIEPVRVSSTIVLPEGSLFRGQIVKSQPPRVLSRSGSVMLRFTSLSLPGGKPVQIAASVGGAEVDQRSHTSIDPEGMVRGERPGKAWMLLNIGVSSGIAKEADDGTQLLIEAIVSTATDASTAGVAKIASACASGIFMLTRHGRDVILPKYTEMQIVFDRPVSLPALIAQK